MGYKGRIQASLRMSARLSATRIVSRGEDEWLVDATGGGDAAHLINTNLFGEWYLCGGVVSEDRRLLVEQDIVLC
jgi:hypothetical protein